VFDLHSKFQECNLGIKRDLPVKITINNDHYKYKDVDAVDIVMLTIFYLFFTVHENRDLLLKRLVTLFINHVL